jgi:hypothetical protein
MPFLSPILSSAGKVDIGKVRAGAGMVGSILERKREIAAASRLLFGELDAESEA